MRTKKRRVNPYNRKKLLSEVGPLLQKKGFEAKVYTNEGYFLIQIKNPDAKQKRILWLLPRRMPRRTLAKVIPFPKTWIFQVFDESDFYSIRRLANDLSLLLGFRHNLSTKMRLSMSD